MFFTRYANRRRIYYCLDTGSFTRLLSSPFDSCARTWRSIHVPLAANLPDPLHLHRHARRITGTHAVRFRHAWDAPRQFVVDSQMPYLSVRTWPSPLSQISNFFGHAFCVAAESREPPASHPRSTRGRHPQRAWTML